jgi:DNA-binding CsgD family transcriptional regulator
MSEAWIADGQAALKAGRWQAAADAFTRALTSKVRADALLGLGRALWWLGDARRAMSQLEDAYAAFIERDDPPWAAACALRIAFHQRAHLANHSAAQGWLARATRLIQTHDLAFLHGEHLLMQSYLAHDRTMAEAAAREALACGRTAGNRDLELSALSQLGACLVDLGRVDEGMALLGEAMAACLGRETEDLETVVFANCTTIVACVRCADLRRAAHWVRAGRQLAERHGIPYLDVECRAVYGEVQFALGHWAEAEELASAAVALSAGHAPAYHATGAAVLARIRLAQGRREEAERLLYGLEEYTACVPVIARLQVQHGSTRGALEYLRRHLDLVTEDDVASVPMVELLGEIEAVEGRHSAACECARRLMSMADRGHGRMAVARGERLLGRGLAPSSADTARLAFGRALATFTDLGLRYEVALTQFAAAAACADSQPDLAVLDARAALLGFETLGASGDADQAVSFLRSLGDAAVRCGPKGWPGLTQREREVLGLLGEGLSNPEIAERLFLSRKTVEHHVAHVLSKLGVRTRAQAAAEAVRRPDLTSRFPPSNR